MKRTGTQDRPCAPPPGSASTSTANTAGAADLPANPADNSKNAQAKPAIYSKPASSDHKSAVADFKPGDERREQYIERGQQPSFEFAVIEDEHVLKAEARLLAASQNLAAARPVQTEESRRLSVIAAAIQRMMEGEVASVLRELAQAPQESAGPSSTQDAKRSFGLFIHHFQQAKLAAADGNRSNMAAALTLALDQLAGLAGRHAGKAARQARAPRIFSGAALASLHALANACSDWAGEDNPLARNGAARARAESGSSDTADARVRSVSSPAQVKKTQERERGRSASAQAPSHKKPLVVSAPAERQARPDEVAAPRSPTSPGKKLKSFFSRAGEGRARPPGEDSDPGSPRSRPGWKGGAETSTSTTTEVRASSPSRSEKQRDIED